MCTESWKEKSIWLCWMMSGRGDWDKLKTVFPHNKKRCRVLLTTRNVDVAEHANRDPSSFYRLDFLPLEDSRKLLRWRVFHEDEMDESHSNLLRYEIEIAKICDGLPLAVVLIAGVLSRHPHRVGWWKDVANSLKDYVVRDITQTRKLIEFAYKHLPNYLRPCFLYFGVFSYDSEILVWKLVRLWISEGFIQRVGDINLEDSAEKYLKELVRRNLVMVSQVRKNGRIKTCRMHEALWEFCRRKAAEDKLFQIVKRSRMIGNLTLDQLRRLSTNDANILERIFRAPTGKCVRSFLTFVKEETSVEPELVSCIPKTFRLLRVLETQSLTFNRFPADMCNLVLLKYVAISSTFSILPAAMSSLWSLQTLIVMTTSDTLDIKADLWMMPQFRHLHTNSSATLPTSSPQIKNSEAQKFPHGNIQTLCTISPESCTKEVLDQDPKLRKLGIYGKLTKLFEVHGISSFLSKLHRFEALENLKLLNDDTNSKLHSIPKQFPKWLKKITLMNTRLEWREMSTLGKLESLEVLKLRENAFQGYFWNTERGGGFCSLRHLYLGQTDLVVWEVRKDYFPKLKSLELNGCSELQTFPHSLADIPSLQMVVIHCVNPMVASSARRLQVLRREQARKKCPVFSLSVYPPGHLSFRSV